MANFKQTNPEDNPQPGDSGYVGPYPRKDAEGKDVMPGDPQYEKLEMSDAEKEAMARHAGGPGPRMGLTGVDKPHGGGSLSSEQMAADRRPMDDSRRPGGNPNNPNDRNNPDSTDARGDRAQHAKEGNTGVKMAADASAKLTEGQRQEALRQQGLSGGTEGRASSGEAGRTADGPFTGPGESKADEGPTGTTREKTDEYRKDQSRE